VLGCSSERTEEAMRILVRDMMHCNGKRVEWWSEWVMLKLRWWALGTAKAAANAQATNLCQAPPSPIPSASAPPCSRFPACMHHHALCASLLLT